LYGLIEYDYGENAKAEKDDGSDERLLQSDYVLRLIPEFVGEGPDGVQRAEVPDGLSEEFRVDALDGEFLRLTIEVGRAFGNDDGHGVYEAFAEGGRQVGQGTVETLYSGSLGSENA